MAGPWEKYQAALDPVGPWTKYGQQSDQEAQSGGASLGVDAKAPTELLEKPLAIQEMPPDISEADRFVAKNSNSPKSAVDFLQGKYPQYQVKHYNNNIYFQRPEDKFAYVLDPEFSLKKDLTSTEGLKDAADVAVPVAQGAISNAAAGAAGLAAAPAGGLAAIPAAMAAGGATNATLEALKQKLIQKFGGVPQDVSGTDVAFAGGAGALSPLLFGGASAGAAEKAAADAGLMGPAAEDFVASQKGLVGRALPKFLSMMSGIPKETVETAGKRLPEINALDEAPDPISQLGSRAVDQFGNLKQAQKNVGSLMNTARANANSIPMNEARAPILGEIAKLEERAANEGLTKRQELDLNALKSLLEEHFASDTVSPENSLDIKRGLFDAAKKGENTVASNAAERAGGALNATEQNAIPELKDLNPQYSSIKNILEQVGAASENKNKAFNLLQGIGTKSKGGLREDLAAADAEHGTSLIDTAKLIQAFNAFKKSRALEFGLQQAKERAGAETLGAGLGGYAGYESGGGYPAAFAGIGLGGATGAMLGSPSATRLFLQGQRSFGAPALNPALPLWDSLRDYYKQNHQEK